jgi:large subunit ribosomal protein L27e
MLTPAFQVVIIQPVDSGNKSHPYGHALVAGIERYPSRITRRMSKTRQEKRSKVKPFIKVINYNHLMPTRYTLELEGLKSVLNAETFKEVSQREDAKKTVKKVLEERYTSGKNRWFFTPLRMSPHQHSRAGIGTFVLTAAQAFERFSHNWLGGANGFFGLYTAFITELNLRLTS